MCGRVVEEHCIFRGKFLADKALQVGLDTKTKQALVTVHAGVIDFCVHCALAASANQTVFVEQDGTSVEETCVR